ncbi:agmatinase [Halobacteriovorax sp. HLS]|uniref:agmatinase n=1 Tax=Halobacteriovorax sp. HLS TaxID=2234000 RepID=UPI001F4EE1A0|nr:agmatinase [Halobacteriovorax sp. HLS]
MEQLVLKSELKNLKVPEIEYINSNSVNSVYSNAIHIIGFEFDGTACFRKGTKDGPDALREVSEGIEDYSPYMDMETCSIAPYYDLGNLSVGTSDDIDANWLMATEQFFDIFSDINLEKSGVKILTLGGEHSISYAPIKTYLDNYDDLVLVHLDAHADLRDGYLGHHHSHASIIRRSLDHFKDSHELIQYGIRSGTKEEFEWMNENKTIRKSRQEFLASIEKIDDNRPIYLTLDLDYFDPSFLPGTGTPEAGGEDFHSFISLVKILKNKNFVGCDVVELSPSIDSSGNSNVFATKVVRELLLALA